MTKEINNIRNSNNITINDNSITVINNNTTSVYKSKNYSTIEFTFLKLINDDAEIVSQKHKTIYKTWTASLLNPPYIHKNINNINNKKSVTLLELQKHKLETLTKYDTNKCIYMRLKNKMHARLG
jgi:hypothetical protein